MALTGFFRISLHKGDKYILVKDEIEFVNNFVKIQQIRFQTSLKSTTIYRRNRFLQDTENHHPAFCRKRNQAWYWAKNGMGYYRPRV